MKSGLRKTIMFLCAVYVFATRPKAMLALMAAMRWERRQNRRAAADEKERHDRLVNPQKYRGQD